MKVTIRRSWTLPERTPMGEWERLVREAIACGLVTEWDDGRGRVPWYDARRCKAERLLYLACCGAVDAKGETVLP